MKEAILDTNFILTCVKQKIDFFHDLELGGIKILIPKQVIKEIKNIASSKKKLHFREDAKLALKILDKNNFKQVNLKVGYVDKALIQFAQENKKIIVATLDKEIKNKIQTPKLVIRRKTRLEII